MVVSVEPLEYTSAPFVESVGFHAKSTDLLLLVGAAVECFTDVHVDPLKNAVVVSDKLSNIATMVVPPEIAGIARATIYTGIPVVVGIEFCADHTEPSQPRAS